MSVGEQRMLSHFTSSFQLKDTTFCFRTAALGGAGDGGGAAETVSPSDPSAAMAIAAATETSGGAASGPDGARKWASFRHICGVAVYQEEQVIGLPRAQRSFLTASHPCARLEYEHTPTAHTQTQLANPLTFCTYVVASASPTVPESA